MKKQYTLLGIVAVFLSGCGKDEPKPGGWVEAAPKYATVRVKEGKTVTKEAYGDQPEVIKKVVPPPVVLPKLGTLKVNAAGWQTEYLPNENLWYIDRPEKIVPGGDIKYKVRITVTRSPTQTEPTELGAYIKFLQKPDEGGFIWPQIVQSGNLGDGFYIVAQVRQASDITKNNNLDTGFIVVRTIGGDRLKFKCHKVDLVTQQEAIEICKNASF
jgi:hypothetical protein